MEGLYNGLGGHVEKGESVLESAKREIKEESGLWVNNLKLRGIVHVSNFYGKEVILFVASGKSDSTEVVASEEGDLYWFDTNNLDGIRLFEDVKPILKHILAMKPEEIFFGASVFDGKEKLLSLDITIS